MAGKSTAKLGSLVPKPPAIATAFARTDSIKKEGGHSVPAPPPPPKPPVKK